MREISKTKIGEEFKPAPQFKKLYYIYLMLGTLVGILPWCIPVVHVIFQVSDNAPFVVTFFVLIPLLSILMFIAYFTGFQNITIRCVTNSQKMK